MSGVPSIPDHTLLRPVGRGAYGEVWLARNVMGTPRAVKIVWRGQFESDRPYDREFAGIQGYEPVSRTSDGLMQVLHVGRNEAEGYFYYVMELADDVVEGPTTTDVMPTYTPHTLRAEMKRQGRLPVARCLRIALDLSAGLACLHRHRLVHRDVKPGNIIFVNGRAKLADIGLVSTRNEGRTFVGTEGYIPPEGPGSPAADLYALGMVLYEAATGQPPERFPQTSLEWFSEGSGTEQLEFHELVLKAGEGARERRYQSAVELQTDLALLQSGQSLRRVRALQRRANRSRRLALAALLAVLAAVGSTMLGSYRVRVESEQRAREQAWREEAERARAQAERAEQQVRAQLLVALVEQSRADVRSGELGQRVKTLDAVRRAASLTNSPELRQTALAALVLPDLRFEREIPLASDVTVAMMDPTFERLVVGRGTNAVEIRNAGDGRILTTLPASVQQSAQGVLWSPDARYVAITRSGQPPAWQAAVEVWDIAAARQVLRLPATRYGACSFHPHLPRLLAADRDDTLALWDLPEGREAARHSVTGLVHHVKFSPDGESYAVQHRIGKAWFTSLLQASNGLVRSSVPSGWVDAIAWHPRDEFVALASRQGEVYLHDRRTGQTSVLGRHKGEGRSAVFSPDGSFLFTGGEEQEVACWDLATRQLSFRFAARGGHIQFASQGVRCAVLARGALKLYELVGSTGCRDLPGDLGATVRSAAFSPDGRWLAVGGLIRVGLWDLHGARLPAVVELAEHASPFFSPDSSELLAYNIQGLSRWRLEARGGAAPGLRPLPAPKTGRIRSGEFAGSSLVLAADGGLAVYPSLDAVERQLYILGSVHTAASRDGRWLAVDHDDRVDVGTLHPWVVRHSIPVAAEIHHHAFTPGGRELALATATGLIFVDTRDWKTQRACAVGLDHRARVLFQPDGRSFWLAQDARSAALYDAQALAPVFNLPSGVLPLAVSPEGERVLVSIDGSRLQLWNWNVLRGELRKLGLEWDSSLGRLSSPSVGG